MADQPDIVRTLMLSGAYVAGTGALIALGLYVAGYRRLFFPDRKSIVRWNGLALIMAFIVFLTGSIFTQAALHRSKFYQQVYGANSPIAQPPQDQEPPDDPEEIKRLGAANTLRFLWASVFAFPLQMLAIGFLYWSQVRRFQWRPKNAANHYVSGYLTWLIVTPTAYIIFVLANVLHHNLTNKPPDKHPLTQIGEVAGSLEYALFIIQTILLAPILEECIFRGIVMPWMMSRKANDTGDPALTVPPTYRPLTVMMLALAVTAIIQLDNISKMVVEDSLRKAMAHLVPILFFALLIPAFVIVPTWQRLRSHLRIRSENDVRAIMASAALFAAFHASVWPSPVPLLVLSLGLSYLYVRTRSLIGPIVVHALFNAVSAIYVLLGGVT